MQVWTSHSLIKKINIYQDKDDIYSNISHFINFNQQVEHKLHKISIIKITNKQFRFKNSQDVYQKKKVDWHYLIWQSSHLLIYIVKHSTICLDNNKTRIRNSGKFRKSFNVFKSGWHISKRERTSWSKINKWIAAIFLNHSLFYVGTSSHRCCCLGENHITSELIMEKTHVGLTKTVNFI